MSSWMVDSCLPLWPLAAPHFHRFPFVDAVSVCPLLSRVELQRRRLSVRWTEALLLCNSCSISICTLTVCLAPTAGLYKLITVNCVPPLHNQLMGLRPVRCAPEGWVSVCVCVCASVCVCVCVCMCVTVFNVQYEIQWIWTKIHYNLHHDQSWTHYY